MDKLKELLAAKRKAAEEEFGGKKFAKRAEIEELRLAKLRAEEAKEREAKVRCLGGCAAGSSMSGGGSRRLPLASRQLCVPTGNLYEADLPPRIVLHGLAVH